MEYNYIPPVMAKNGLFLPLFDLSGAWFISKAGLGVAVGLSAHAVARRRGERSMNSALMSRGDQEDGWWESAGFSSWNRCFF